MNERELADRIVGIVADAMDGQAYSHTETVEVILPMLQAFADATRADAVGARGKAVEEIMERCHWGPELCCPRCGQKEWLMLDEGAVCSNCYEGVMIKAVYKSTPTPASEQSFCPNSVWPNLVPPQQYENPDPRWTDPKAVDLQWLWTIGRKYGYAIGLHGSLKRDMDLIAVPWTDEAVGNAELVEKLCADLPAEMVSGPERKPHGRYAVTLQLDGYYKPIDLSIMPRTPASDVGLREALVKIEGITSRGEGRFGKPINGSLRDQIHTIAHAAITRQAKVLVDEKLTCVKANPQVYEFRDDPKSVVKSSVFFELCPTDLVFNDGDTIRVIVVEGKKESTHD